MIYPDRRPPSSTDLLMFAAAGAVARNQLAQVIAVRSIPAKCIGIKQPLDAAIGADPIGVMLVVLQWPTHVAVPAASEKNRGGGT